MFVVLLVGIAIQMRSAITVFVYVNRAVMKRRAVTTVAVAFVNVRMVTIVMEKRRAAFPRSAWIPVIVSIGNAEPYAEKSAARVKRTGSVWMAVVRE